MTYIKVAVSNLRRNPVRGLLTGLSLAVSAATLCVVLSLDRGYTAAVTEDLVKNTGVHLYVSREGCPIEAAAVVAQGGLSPLYVDEDIVERLQAVPELDAVLPFKLFSMTARDGSRTDIFMGVTEAVRSFKPDWRFAAGGWFSSPDSVILGAKIAHRDNLDIGRRFYSSHFDREFEISGILESGFSQDDGIIFLPLTMAQALTGREGKLSAVALRLKDISAMDAVQNRLRAMIPGEYFVTGSKELSEGILRFFGATRAIMFVMVAVAFVVSVFGIVNTMLMTVLERRREIAYLKCVGAGTWDLLRLISLETAIIAVCGSAFGVAAGLVLSPLAGGLLRSFLVAYVPSGAIARPDAVIAAAAFAVCALTGLACSLYPAFRAAGIVPMEVLRNE